MTNTCCDRLLDWMADGKEITDAQAREYLGFSRLSGRIYDLRKRGYVITAEKRPVKNRYGDTCRVAYYRLHGRAALKEAAE